ncbi:hypothetical protein FB45DRAFT_1070754 [Roridomyces roridus]|uniref:Uncharacterized protein n=1 Tax=Roridomyces roridus TaxID=1738132 RepID=A0AAD7AYS5_9AGAR|nr:hypothetical protein FB45DRAFT_1070754 [Roridomyces roridus]
MFWQAVYFACRAHFHGETAEVIWAFLNPLGSSTRQSTGAARHDIMNYVADAWNELKVLRQGTVSSLFLSTHLLVVAAQLLADERVEVLRLFEMHMAVVEDLSRQHVDKVPAWSRLSRIATVSPSGIPQSVYQHESTSVLTVEDVLSAMLSEEQQRSSGTDSGIQRTWVAKWIHDGMTIERQQYFIIGLLANYREHPLQETLETITKLRESLNASLTAFRETQREVYPRLVLSGLDTSEPELTAIQLPSYRIKHKQRSATGLDPNGEDYTLHEAEIKLRCSQATNGILAVRSASLSLSAVKKARDLDYRGQAGITRSQRNLQKAEYLKAFEISEYNRARNALVHLGYMTKDATEPYPLLTARDTRRKETHLHRATGDSRLFDGTAWYLQSGTTRTLNRPVSVDVDVETPTLMTGTRNLKRAGFIRSPNKKQNSKNILPEDTVVASSPSSSEAEDSDSDVAVPPAKRRLKKGKGRPKAKKQKQKSDGWIWLESVMRGREVSEEKMIEYKQESDRVQWFRAEAEMYRWLEQYERKHAELMRVIARYRRDSEVWSKLGDREEAENGAANGASTFARMQAAMYSRLEYNARLIFNSAESGAHHDWVSATTFDDLVVRIDRWRDEVFKWMDELIRRSDFISGRDFNAKIPNLRPDSEGNGFVHTVMEAYNHHRALVIRPDDLWLAILSQFNFFVNANAEVLRANFVAHEGQRKLLVEASGDRYSVDFGAMSRQVTTLLHENVVDPALRDWVLPNFTTTTVNHTTVAAVLMVATLKEYFRVGFGLPWCGIPRVTLEGEKSDWVNILERLEKLKEYGVETIAWYHLLRPVISRFVAAFDKPTSQENTDFWQKIVSVDSILVFSKQGRWMGKPLDMKKRPSPWDTGEVVLDGTPYHTLDTYLVPPAYAEVDIDLNDRGMQIDCFMLAGVIGTRISSSGDTTVSASGENDTVHPLAGWWICARKEKVVSAEEEHEAEMAEFNRRHNQQFSGSS